MWIQDSISWETSLDFGVIFLTVVFSGVSCVLTEYVPDALAQEHVIEKLP